TASVPSTRRHRRTSAESEPSDTLSLGGRRGLPLRSLSIRHQSLIFRQRPMRTQPSLLLPIFRSDGQRRLLARLYLAPERAVPLADLARELGIDRGGVKREADRLERAGLVRSERVGRQRILRANADSPYFQELYGLLVKAFGPETAVATELEQVGGIEEAYLYGS